MRKFLYTVLLFVGMAVVSTASAQQTADDEHYRRGIALFETGEWFAAQNEFRKALEQPGIDEPRRTELEYLIAASAAELGQPGAENLVDQLLDQYPGSVYDNMLRYYAGTLLYNRGEYAAALEKLLAVDTKGLNRRQKDEYNFKTGHAFFTEGDYVRANNLLQQVDPQGAFAPHAKYYIAYIEYADGQYDSAKEHFSELADVPSYEKIVPFYLLQIEFFEGNYDYVIENGDPLIAAATEKRQAELNRMMAEAWFHREGYAQCLDYMRRFRATGGSIGRNEHYLTGFSAYKEGDWKTAAEELAQVVGPDDRLSQNASYHLADCYLKLGDKQRAMQSFSIASAANYDEAISENALFNYGKLQYELGSGRFNEAINVLNRYMTLYPNNESTNQVRAYLISAYYNSHDYEAAYNAIMQYPNPDNNIKAALQKITYFRALECWNAGDIDQATKLLANAAQYRYNPKYTALTSFWQGEILYAQGNYLSAIPKFQSYLKLSPASEPENLMARYDLGYCYFNLQDWNQANKWFSDFLSRYKTRDRYRADAFNRLGDVQHAERSYWKAIESYDAAAAINTEDKYYSAYQRALMLGLVERPERKIESLRKIISTGEGDYVDDATYELGRTYIAGDRFNEGVAALKQFIARYPQSEKYADALLNLGLAYLNVGDKGQALNYYKMVVDYAPKSSEAQDALASIRSIYVDSNDVDSYFDYAKKSGVETDLGALQRDSLTFISAEKVYLSGNPNRATKALSEYLSAHPDGRYTPTALYYLSDCYIQTSVADSAIAVLSQLSALKQNDYTVRGLEKLASLTYQEKRYRESAEAYKRLIDIAPGNDSKQKAITGYVDAIVAEGDPERIKTMADEVIAMGQVPAASLRKAKFAKATVLRETGSEALALDIYRELSQEVQSAEGAESAYRVIEALYRSGDRRGAEKAIFDFSDKKSPQTYWVGMAFLTLGDIYVDDGDSFQARATYQSIVDGYTPDDDGIVEAARERISKLK